MMQNWSEQTLTREQTAKSSLPCSVAASLPQLNKLLLSVTVLTRSSPKIVNPLEELYEYNHVSHCKCVSYCTRKDVVFKVVHKLSDAAEKASQIKQFIFI